MWSALTSKRTSRWHLYVLFVLAVTVGLPASSTGVQAGTLSEFQCADLRAKRDALASLGAADDLRRGPAWGSSTPDRDRLTRVRQFLTTLEQVLFRCQSIPRDLSDGMDFAVNMPDPKPFHERRTFPLPVRKPAGSIGLRSTSQ